MRCRGQLSLEYLILLAAVLAVFAMLLPLLSSIYSHGLFALDSINAKQFAASLQQHADEMQFQADGAIASLSVKPFKEWGIHSNGRDFFITVPCSECPEGKSNEFAVDFPNEITLSAATLGREKETQFTLQKGKNRAGEITLEYA